MVIFGYSAANVSLSKDYVSDTNIAFYISFIGEFGKKAGIAIKALKEIIYIIVYNELRKP
jgi:hypothetical protein